MNAVDRIRAGRRARRLRWALVTVSFAALTLILAVLSLLLGNTVYSLSDLIRVISGDPAPGASFAIGTLKAPRMLAGIIAGLSFGTAGSTFQKLLHNPLASPDVIGIASSSSAAAVFCMLVLRWSGPPVSIASVCAALITAALLFALSRGGSFAGGRLILIGIGVGAMLRSVISYLLLRASRYDVPGAYRWLNGSLNGIQMKDVVFPALVTALFCPLILLLSRKIPVLELGEQAASALGVKVESARLALMLCAVTVTAFASALTGPIAFVAFLAGPLAGRLTGSGGDGGAVLSSGLMGAILVLGADLAGQFAFNTKFPVGVITGILGAPYLIFLLIRGGRGTGSFA
jgi:iron complex transport system permease protein